MIPSRDRFATIIFFNIISLYMDLVAHLLGLVWNHVELQASVNKKRKSYVKPTPKITRYKHQICTNFGNKSFSVTKCSLCWLYPKLLIYKKGRQITSLDHTQLKSAWYQAYTTDKSLLGLKNVRLKMRCIVLKLI